ncbi:MAG: tetratricopeptide repeat protein, partial [Candidatus Eremiobacterota bacterium]
TLLRLERFDESLAAFDRVVELEPDHLRAVSNRGDLLGRLGRAEEAVAAYERALELAPQDARLWVRLGQARLDLGQNPEALKALDRALELDESNWEAWSNRGLALCNLDRLEDALESYDRALVHESEHPAILGNKAVALEVMQELDRALECAARWIELQPEQAEAWLCHGRILDKLDRREEAQASLDKALSLNPEVMGPMQVYGLALVDDEGQAAPEFPPVQVRSNMPPQEVVRQFIQMLLAQGHRLENERINGKYRIAVFPVQQVWGVGLFDENGQPNTDVPPMQVETDLPPEQFVGQYVEMLRQKGHHVDQNGLVDGKYRVGVFPLQPMPPTGEGPPIG